MHGKSSAPLVTALLIIFTAGVLLGAISVYHIPASLRSDAGEIVTRSLGENVSVYESVKNDFTVELVWSIVVWVLGTLSVLAPFIAATVALRGFTIGFSSAFILSLADGGRFKLICAFVLPQCVFSLPAMTIFSILCIRMCTERKAGEATDGKYFVFGAVFVPIIFILSVVESLFSGLLIKLL